MSTCCSIWRLPIKTAENHEITSNLDLKYYGRQLIQLKGQHLLHTCKPLYYFLMPRCIMVSTTYVKNKKMMMTLNPLHTPTSDPNIMKKPSTTSLSQHHKGITRSKHENFDKKKFHLKKLQTTTPFFKVPSLSKIGAASFSSSTPGTSMKTHINVWLACKLSIRFSGLH